MDLNVEVKYEVKGTGRRERGVHDHGVVNSTCRLLRQRLKISRTALYVLYIKDPQAVENPIK